MTAQSSPWSKLGPPAKKLSKNCVSLSSPGARLFEIDTLLATSR